MVEHCAENAGVPGSIPGLDTEQKIGRAKKPVRGGRWMNDLGTIFRGLLIGIATYGFLSGDITLYQFIVIHTLLGIWCTMGAWPNGKGDRLRPGS